MADDDMFEEDELEPGILADEDDDLELGLDDEDEDDLDDLSDENLGNHGLSIEEDEEDFI